MEKLATVYLVVGDRQDLDPEKCLLESAGFSVEAYASAERLLDRNNIESPGCLVTDFRLPGLTGLELYQALKERGVNCPLIVMTGQSDVATAVSAFREGALDFIEKPFDHDYFVARVREAVDKATTDRARLAEKVDTANRIASLTRRESEVAILVAEGVLTKQIANRLGIRENTVEVHRSHIMKKMNVRSVAQLVRMMTRHLDISGTEKL